MNIITRSQALLWALVILAAAGLSWLGTCAASWWSGQYELTWKPFRITRRWYGPRAHVRLRGEAGLFRVQAWDAEDLPVPWLKVCPVLDDDDTGPFCRPVTDFKPYRVLMLRPSMFRRWRFLPIPLAWVYEPLPAPVGGLRSEA